MNKNDLKKEARSLRPFLTDPDLVGWFWPHQHARAVAFLRKHDKVWFEKNQDKVLPPEPIKRVELIRAALEDELLV